MKEEIKNLITSSVHQKFNLFYETMLSCFLKCKKKKKKSENTKVVRTKKGTILKSKCALRNSKKSRFIKQEEASGVLNS